MSDIPTTGNEELQPPLAGELPQSEINPTLPVDPPAASEDKIISALHQLELGLGDKLNQIETRLGTLESALDAATRQVSFLPPQVRNLAGKVEGLGGLLTESRYQALLLRLLTFYDLLNQMCAAQANCVESGELVGLQPDMKVLYTQLRQILEANGLAEIETAGGFNPELHRSVKKVPCWDPSQDGKIAEVVRPGFRTEHSILRFAEVTVNAYVPPLGERIETESI